MPKKLLMTASTWSHIRNFHLPYLRQLQHLGWETHVGCRGIPANVPEVDRGIELPFEKRMTAPANLRAARQMRALVREERYDLIVTHTALASFFTRLAVKGLPERPRLVNVVHGYLFDDETGAARRQVLLSAERITAPETDLLLTMNAYDTRLAAEKHLAKTCAYIPGVGVDFSRLDRPGAEDGAALRRELGIAPEDFVLIYAAEFSARKSQSVLLEAMKLLPERAQLILCGDGETLQRCREQARQTGLAERVHFPGHISDMPRWYRMADAAVSASRIEGLPFNVMEAMYLGLPTVASNVKGHSDLIEDGVTGLLYPYGDAASCAACIRRLMDDAGLRVLLAGRGRESVLQYRLEAVLPRLLGYYLGRETSGAGSESP